MSQKKKKKIQKEKIGIILTGGGMRCAYSAGAMVALVKEFGLTKPYALAAESGSVGNAMYYLAEQYDAGKLLWTKLLSDKKLIGTIPLINVDYLVDEIFKKKVPLNTRNIEKTTTRYFFSVTNIATGKTEFVTNKSLFDFYEVMRAAKAVPILYRKKVRLGIKKYIDGGVSANIGDLAKQVLTTGATALITINCEPNVRDLSMKLALGLDARIHGKRLRDAMLHDLSLPPGLCPVSDTAKVICISPTKPLNMKVYSNSKEKLVRAFNLGYVDVAENKELAKLFNFNKRK